MFLRWRCKLITFNQCIKSLKKWQKIQNWTPLKGYYGEDFWINNIYPEFIEINIKKKNFPKVTKNDFETIARDWEKLKSLESSRSSIPAHIRTSKYILSILHYIETEIHRGTE